MVMNYTNKFIERVLLRTLIKIAFKKIDKIKR